MAQPEPPVLLRLLLKNADWAKKVGPEFHKKQAEGQDPKVLWIGCSDSRVPESVITESIPGDIFVTRNIANQVPPKDDNVLSVIDYAVLHLNVNHVIVVGHTKCGGAKAAIDAAKKPPVPPHDSLTRWLEPLIELARTLPPIPDEDVAITTLVEKSVRNSALTIAKSHPLEEAWRLGKNVAVHGWIFEIETGLLKDLGINITRAIHEEK